MNKEISTTTKPINKRKMIVLELPVAAWEKFNALHEAMQNSVPGITHDMIVSAWVLEKIKIDWPPGATVETEQHKLNDHDNGS